MGRKRELRAAAVLGVAALGTFLAGCRSDTEPSVSAVTTSTDTVGGIVHVRHTGAPAALAIEPLFDLGKTGEAGEAPPPEEFGRVQSVIADAAGDVYVADGIALEIRVFGPDGHFLRTTGRKGQGPGEFEGIHGIAWLAGDTMVAMDYGNARLTLLESDGTYAGQWTWLRLTGDARFLFNGGPREIYAHDVTRSAAGSGALRSLWVRYTPEGPRDSLDIPRAEPRPGTSEICRGDGIGFESNQYGDRFMSAPAPGGERVVAWSGAYRLAFLDAAGDTVRVVSRDVAPMPLPDSMWAPLQKEVDDFERTWHGADCTGSITRPEHLPILRDITFDYDGRLLVEHTTADSMAFDVLTPAGRFVETFPSPPDRDTSVPPFLRGNRLYLVTKDSLDVQHVRGFLIEGGRT